MFALTGSLTDVLRRLLNRSHDPVVGVPAVDTARAVVDALDGHSLRLLCDSGVVENLPRTHQMQLADDGIQLREHTVSSLWLTGVETSAVAETGGPETIALVDESPLSELRDRWERGTPVSVDQPALSAVVETVDDRMRDGAADVWGQSVKARGEISPEGLLVWGGAVSESSWSSVVKVAEETGLCSRGTLQRRLSRLQDEDLVQTIPMQRETRGGRPNRLAVRDHVDVERSILPPEVVGVLS